MSGLLAWRGRRELLDLSASYDGVLKQQDEQTEVLQQQVWLRSGQRLLAEKVVGQSTPALVGPPCSNFWRNIWERSVAALYVRDKESTACYTARLLRFQPRKRTGVAAISRVPRA